MEAWRQWPLGGENNDFHQAKKNRLDPTGLLMEDDYTQNPEAPRLTQGSSALRKILHACRPKILQSSSPFALE
jgi:hypothetical protein